MHREVRSFFKALGGSKVRHFVGRVWFFLSISVNFIKIGDEKGGLQRYFNYMMKSVNFLGCIYTCVVYLNMETIKK